MNITHHAVERFRDRWRPGSTLEQAHAELEDIVTSTARPTKHLTVVGDARRYVALTSTGEQVFMAVRDNTVITVFPRGAEGSDLLDIHADEDLALESAEDRAACARMIAADNRGVPQGRPAGRPPTPHERSRMLNAKRTLAAAARGEHITQNAQIRARIVLERWKTKFGEGA